MAQTKRKRRTKHRGNAAGAIEARGRTGRKPNPEEVKKTTPQRGRRPVKPPSWNSAAIKALVMASLLFVLTQLGVLGNEATVSQGLVLSVMALLIYTPLAYMTDRFVYNRMLKAQAKKKS
jgi:hypothetical protein